MSGLVNGLQNRLRRFESARHLKKICWNLIIDGVPFFKKEGWQSDRSRWTRNPVYPYGYRGFESLTFRQKKKGNRRNGFLLLLLSIRIFLNKPFGN